MRKKKLIPALALTLALLCGITIGAGASNGLQEIKAYLNSNITVKMDGEAQTFLNAQGTRVYPITYQGTTYLPVRAVAGLVGLDVNWDQATQTVELGQTKGVDLIDIHKYYDRSTTDNQQVQSSEKKEQEISGITCSHWVKLHASWAWDKGSTSRISFNVLGKYDTLTFQYYSNTDTILRVLGDNDSVLFEINVTGGEVAKTATVPLFKTNQITFEIEKPFDGGNVTDTYIFGTYLE